MPEMPGSCTLITFLSDFGQNDGSVGVCQGVMHRIAPEARVIDIAHDLPPFQVIPAAYLLRIALPYFEIGIHIAVVDPGVGTKRRALALRTGDGRTLVGPDNGLLVPAALESGGVAKAVEINDSLYGIDQVSKTFHGRDIFCPVGAHLAEGKSLSDVGEPIDPAKLTDLSLPEPTISKESITAGALFSDRFGNVSLNLGPEHMSGAGFSPGSHVDVDIDGKVQPATWRVAFGDAKPGDLILFEDSFGTMALATNHGSARDALDIEPLCVIKLINPR